MIKRNQGLINNLYNLSQNMSNNSEFIKKKILIEIKKPGIEKHPINQGKKNQV